MSACSRVAAAERDGTLAALLDELSADAAHLEACETCRAALARYRRLAQGLRELGAPARRRPDHVARVLAAEAAEAAAAAAAAPVTPLRPKRRAMLVVAAPLTALAAVAALLWWLRRDPAAPAAPSPEPPVRFAFQVVPQPGAPALRGDAHLGDQLRVTLPAGSALWIFRNDRELLLRCPRDCQPQPRALTGAVTLDTLGRYQIVWLSTDQVPPPSGELERDIAAARAAGATHELRELEVE